MLDQLPFGAVWVVDFEYTQPDGGLPVIDFLRPAPGGALAGAAVENDRPPRGSKPDIGAMANAGRWNLLSV